MGAYFLVDAGTPVPGALRVDEEHSGEVGTRGDRR